MLENFQPQFGTQIVVVKNVPYTLVQTDPDDPWSIMRGETLIGSLYRPDGGGWAVWPMLDACTYIPRAATPGEALRQAL
ncbi:hypothetical protein GCM10027568_32440 [Humibacter soli]